MHNNWAETHLGGGDTSAFVTRRPPLLDHSLRHSLPVQLLQSAHKVSDHTAMMAVLRVPKPTLVATL